MYWGGNCGKKHLRNLRSYTGSEAELEFEGWKSIFFIICQPAPEVNRKRCSHLFVSKMECCKFCFQHCKHCTGGQHCTDVILTHQPPSFTRTILTHSLIYLPTYRVTYMFNVLGRCLEHPTECLPKMTTSKASSEVALSFSWCEVLDGTILHAH